MKRRTIALNDELLFFLQRECHADRPGHNVTLLYGTTRGTTNTAHLWLSAEDAPWERDERIARIKEHGYVPVGQVRLVKDALHDNPRQPHRARLDDAVITPPAHYVFLLRHRIACRSYFHAASFHDEVLLPAHITLKNDHN